MTRLATIAALLLLGGCALDEGDGFGDTLLVPVDVELHWDAAFNEVDDGLGAVVPVDLMVYESTSGAPREGVELIVHPPADAAVLRDADLTPVAPEDCRDCTLFWDAWRDRYYAVDTEPAFAEPVRVSTGPEGLARVHLLVEAFRADGGGFEPADVQVHTDGATQHFRLVPR